MFARGGDHLRVVTLYIVDCIIFYNIYNKKLNIRLISRPYAAMVSAVPSKRGSVYKLMQREVGWSGNVVWVWVKRFQSLELNGTRKFTRSPEISSTEKPDI